MKNTVKYKDKSFSIESHDDHIAKWFQINTFYELAMLQYMESLTGIFVDVGANVGNHSVFFSMVADKVIAFELATENYELLVKNTKGMNVECHNVALSDKKGKTDYTINEGNMGMCAMVKGDKIEVEKLDTLVKKADVIKIDAETQECKIVKGALKLIKKCRPHLFIEAQTKVEMRALDQILIPLDYVRKIAFNKTPTYYYDPGSRNIS